MKPPEKVPYQVPLAIDRPLQQSLETFVVGANRELVRHLVEPLSGFTGIWIGGSAKSGKTHLLRGFCLAQSALGLNIIYVSGRGGRDNVNDSINDTNKIKASLNQSLASLQYAFDRQLPVCVDDIGGFAGVLEAEELLLGCYQRALDNRTLFVAAHEVAAQGLDFTLADLNSRMRSLMHFVLQPLDDRDKAELLRSRAERRGYAINQAVLDYWLARAPRDTGSLLTDLDVLDRATLARKQTVTIPLLKQVLGY